MIPFNSRVPAPDLVMTVAPLKAEETESVCDKLSVMKISSDPTLPTSRPPLIVVVPPTPLVWRMPPLSMRRRPPAGIVIADAPEALKRMLLSVVSLPRVPV